MESSHHQCAARLITMRGDLLDPRSDRLVNVDLEVGASESRDGNPLHIGLEIVASTLEERAELADNLVIATRESGGSARAGVGAKAKNDGPSLVPVDSGVVHLVDNHDELADSRSLDKHGVLARLSSLLESGLEFSLTGRDDENGDVGLSGSGDHLRDEVLVTGSVKNGVATLVGLEVGASDLDSLSLRARKGSVADRVRAD